MNGNYGLEEVYPAGHYLHGRIFYDRMEGSYYDRGSDLYLTLADMRAFGFPC